MATIAERVAELAGWREDTDSLWKAVETAGEHYRVQFGIRDEVYLEFWEDRSSIVIFPDGGWMVMKKEEEVGKYW